MALLLSAPVLGVTMAVSLLVAILQAVTSIRDMTIGTVIKIAAVGVTLLICGGWMMQITVGFTQEIFNHVQAMGK